MPAVRTQADAVAKDPGFAVHNGVGRLILNRGRMEGGAELIPAKGKDLPDV